MEDRKLFISKIFNVSIDKAFDAFTKPEELKKWFCPEVMSVAVAEFDAKIGGSFKIVMKEPVKESGENGAEHTATGVIKEFERPNKLVYTWQWSEFDTEPEETQVTVVFKKVEDNNGVHMTQIDFTHEFFTSDKSRDEHNKGWNSAFNNLGKNFGV